MSSLDEFKSRKVRIFRNGDVHHPGKKFVVSTRIFRNFEQFLLRVSEDLSLVNGAVRRIHTLQGTPVRDLEELEDNGFYVATAGEMFRRSVYPVAGEETERKAMVGRGRRHVAGAAYEAEEGEGEKEREEKLFGPSTKAYRVIVFANGETSNPGIKLVLNHRNCKSFEQLLNVLSNLLRLKTGFVRKLYDAENGRRIQALRDLKDGQNLVAGTWETFRRVKYPLLNPNMTQFDVKKEDDVSLLLKTLLLLTASSPLDPAAGYVLPKR
ncbi:hypothetical protein BC829DRAFT_242968 [Chytridium lagenaria]|nr:hypothetical protein BC829DRAFT_242968 [Chytridium lagenaria]